MKTKTTHTPGPWRLLRGLDYNPHNSYPIHGPKARRPASVNQISGGFWDGTEVISSYSRADAIEDGELIDISELAREAGLKYPVAVSRGVYAILAPWDDGREGDHSGPKEGQALYGLGQSFAGRAWDLLAILLYEVRQGQRGQRVDFAPLFLMGHKWTQDRPMPVKMYAMCGPGDTAEPVITVMLPEED